MAEKQMELEVEPVAEEKAEVAVTKSKDFSVNPYTDKEAFNNLYVMAKQLASSDLVPQAYQNKPTNCMLALETANRMGLSPLFVMEQMSIVRGKRSWSGQACSTLVNNYPKFKDVELVYVGKEGSDDWGAYVTAVRKDNGKTVKGTTVDMKMVKAEGWDSNPKWKSMPMQMLGYRAYAFFARLHCADALNGFAVEGEPEDAFGDKKEAPSFD